MLHWHPWKAYPFLNRNRSGWGGEGEIGDGTGKEGEETMMGCKISERIQLIKQGKICGIHRRWEQGSEQATIGVLLQEWGWDWGIGSGGTERREGLQGAYLVFWQAPSFSAISSPALLHASQSVCEATQVATIVVCLLLQQPCYTQKTV